VAGPVTREPARVAPRAPSAPLAVRQPERTDGSSRRVPPGRHPDGNAPAGHVHRYLPEPHGNGNPRARTSGGHEPCHLGSRHTERGPSSWEAPAGHYRGAHHDDHDQQDSQEVGQ
jgi:hypothetical protein